MLQTAAVPGSMYLLALEPRGQPSWHRDEFVRCRFGEGRRQAVQCPVCVRGLCALNHSPLIAASCSPRDAVDRLFEAGGPDYSIAAISIVTGNRVGEEHV